MDAERLRWLDARLAEAPAKPTMIFMHHPPFKTAIEYMDGIGLEGADAMAEVVRRHPQVERVVCGHLHGSIQARWAGTVAMTVPATAHQVDLDIRDDVGLAPPSDPTENGLCSENTRRLARAQAAGSSVTRYPWRSSV